MKAYLNDVSFAKERNPSDLVQSNLPLVIFFAKKFAKMDSSSSPPSSRHNVYMDLLAEYSAVGNEGLIIASKKYDPTTGNKFSTYARWWIRSKMFELQKEMKEGGLTKIGGSDFKSWQIDSTDRPLGNDDEDNRTVGDHISSEDEIASTHNNEFLYKLLDILSEDERDLISRRFGLDDYGATSAKDLGDLLGCTEQTITGKIRKAIKKVREAAKKDLI